MTVVTDFLKLVGAELWGTSWQTKVTLLTLITVLVLI